MTFYDPRREPLLIQSVIGAMPIAAFVVGLDDAILAWNPAAERVFHVPIADAQRARFKELAPSHRVAGLRAAIEEAKAGAAPILLGEDAPDSEGTASLRYSVAPLRVGAELLGVVVTAEDRSEIEGLRSQLGIVTDDLQATSEQMEQTNEELRVSNEELQAANAQLEARLSELHNAQQAIRHKDDFLAMLAHELRNPLAPILSSVHVLRIQGDDNPAAVRRAREVIERQARHQARLLDDLLDVSRITRGRIELRRRLVDLSAIVAEVIEATRALADARHQEISGPPAPEPLPVEADPIRLAQVVNNLLTNAAKYTPPGGRIAIATERENRTAVLRVRDSGVGIPADMLERVFDLFTQVDPTLARSQGGLGVGLTLVKSLVEMHGGAVTAHSAGPGQGSEFVVRLPLAQTAHTKQAAVDAVAAPARHILIVEDNADAREMLSAALTLEGHRVLDSEDGLRGIEMALLHRPEIILIDIGLPGVSGFEVARRIRAALGGQVKLVALTGYGQPSDRREARHAGFDVHLVKPVTPEDLEVVLRDSRSADRA